MIKPITTLFMLMSVDGKISTGSTDNRDVDKDFPHIEGISNGLNQYYDIEKTTDLFSMNSGKVMVKVGANELKENITKQPVSFIIIDNHPHLNSIGVDYFIRRSNKFFLVTTNKEHPAFQRNKESNLHIIYYKDHIDFIDLFEKLKNVYKIDQMTIQTGGTLNSILLRKKLIDKLNIVIAPALIGGKDTATLVDGKSLQESKELEYIKALKLIEVNTLNDSYLQLKYEIINDTLLN